MILFFDKKQNFITEIEKDAISSAEEDLELNGFWKASIVVPFKRWADVKEYALYFGYKGKNNAFYLYKITKTKVQDKQVTIDGVHIFFDELQGRVIKDKRPKNASSQALSDMVLDGTGWQAVATVSGGRTLNFYYTSSAKAFENIIKAFGCDYRPEIILSGGRIAEKIVHIKESISKDYGKWYEYGDALLDVIEEQDRKSVFTAVIGRGKGIQSKDENGEATGGYGRKLTFADISWSRSNGDPVDKPLGQEYVEIKDATAVLGYQDGTPRIGIKEFSSIEDPNELLRETYKYALKVSHPYLLLKATAIPTDAIELGEIVTIIRQDMGIRYKTKVVRVKTNLLTGISEITIGDQSQVSVAQAISEITADQKLDKLEVMTWIEGIQKSLAHDMFNEDGYTYNLKPGNEYNLPAGLYSFNAPIDKNPTKVIYFGAGKFAIADHKGSDGQWEFQTFGDGSGFTADLIRTGMLQGGKVKWNMETGYLNIGDKLIYDPASGELHLAQGSVTINSLDAETKDKINKALDVTDAVTEVYTEYALGDCGNAAPTSDWERNGLLQINDHILGGEMPLTGTYGRKDLRRDDLRAIRKDGSFSDRTYTVDEMEEDRFYVYADQLPTTSDGVTSSIPVYYVEPGEPDTIRLYRIDDYTGEGFYKVFRKGCLWKRSVFKCADGTVKYSPAERISKDGKSSYFHIAYADDEKGNGMSLIDSDKPYFGQYTDDKKETQFDPSRYKWTRVRGHDGKDGKNGTDGTNGKDGKGVKNVITQYAVVYSDETPSGASWTDTPPSYWSEYAKVWQRLKITYTDGSVETTVPEKFNDSALKALKEKMNTIESGYTEIKDGQADFVTKSALGAVGETSINGFNVTTGAIRSQTGDTYIDLNGSNFTFGGGAMTYSPSDGLKIGRGKYYSTTDDKAWSIWERSDYYGDKKIGGYRPITMSTNDTYGMNLYASKGMRLCLGVEKDDQNHYTNPIEITNETADGEMWCKGYLMFGPEAKFGFDYNDKRAKLGAFYDFDRTRWKMMHCAYFGSPIDFYEDLDMHNYTIRNQSDIRLKNVISGWEVKALDEISAMEFIKFRWKDRPEQEKQIDTEKVHYGISAQSAPFVAVAGEDGYLNIDMTRMTYVNAKAVQELNGKVKQLEEQNKGLQMRIKRLEEAIHDIIGRS